MEETSRRVRKGAWCKEEDELLKACIQQYGEGKWQLVPHRAGLNRCRKSCRLRWLNYLNPNIKRGAFAEDEVDMILRIHKLLGNRWSLIARMIPGRTANDIKNYWNTYMRKKGPSPKEYSSKNENPQPEGTKKTHVIIKPQPQTFSKNSAWLRGNWKAMNVVVDDSNKNTARECSAADQPCLASPQHWENYSMDWWNGLLHDKGEDEERNSSWCLADDKQVVKELVTDNWDEQTQITTMTPKAGSFFVESCSCCNENPNFDYNNIWDCLW